MNIQKLVAIIALMTIGGWLIFTKIASQKKVEPTPTFQEITIKGSDTEVQMVSNLAEQFAKDNPAATISVTGGGSSVGIAALLNGEVPLANSSRPLKAEEVQQFKDRGINYQTLIVARDGLSLVVNPNNPLASLTLAQVGQIYRGEIKDWSEVSSYSGKISLYGRQSTSGTYGFFRDVAVKADYAPQMKNMEGNQAIVDGVINDRLGIGYVGVGYLMNESGAIRPDVKALSIKGETQAEAISPLNEVAVRAGQYPLFRPIYQFISFQPANEAIIKKFLQFEVSPVGQAVVKKAGFFSITPEDEANNAWLNQ